MLFFINVHKCIIYLTEILYFKGFHLLSALKKHSFTSQQFHKLSDLVTRFSQIFIVWRPLIYITNVCVCVCVCVCVAFIFGGHVSYMRQDQKPIQILMCTLLMSKCAEYLLKYGAILKSNSNNAFQQPT